MDDSGLQSARTVAYRALSLGALLKRGELEITLQNLVDYSFETNLSTDLIASHQDSYTKLIEWVEDEKLGDKLTQTESYLIEKPLQSWSERVIINTSWRVESLGIMLWALNMIDEIPDFDTQFVPHDVLTPLDILTPTIDFIWMADLRFAKVLKEARDQAELWHWRSRARELEQLGVRPPAGVSFAEIIRMTAMRGYEEGKLPHPFEGDFPVFGTSYARIDAEQYSLLSSIAYERYFALNWLCELSSEWQSIPVDR